LGQRYGFDGANTQEKAFADSLIERWQDARASFSKGYWDLPEDQRPAGAKKWADEQWPKFGADLEKWSSHHESHFLVGKSLTVADIIWYSGLGGFKGFNVPVTFTPAQQKFISAVEAHPAVAAFLKDAKHNPNVKN